ncbi:RidA family protein [Marinivivus vitaminiproducens]|uniref:RidA family protein n=1 Tax=Marinivivus vitaminiproducens TaxID=3035935 RepID=UPI00279850FE|nr:RidA family protein [Geminicoccaceae bacterium SCSIO 64248]
MTSPAETKLAELGLKLPTPATPVASYIPYTKSGKLVFVSGQVPLVDGKVSVTGKLGESVSLEDGQRAAQDCALNVLAQAKAAAGDLDSIARVLKLTVFVASAPGFTDQPKVANGASDLFVNVLGEAGKHARSAVGLTALPLDSAVEVEAIFELK